MFSVTSEFLMKFFFSDSLSILSMCKECLAKVKPVLHKFKFLMKFFFFQIPYQYYQCVRNVWLR